jgi:hypothetical protein
MIDARLSKNGGKESSCKPGSVPGGRSRFLQSKNGTIPFGCSGDGHFSRTAIARRLQQSTRESIADRTSPRVSGRPGGPPGFRCSLFDLAPGGVCRARSVARPAGELLPHRFTLTRPATVARRKSGGLLSVALSLASRPVGVTHHPVLWCPDFPPVGAQTSAK